MGRGKRQHAKGSVVRFDGFGMRSSSGEEAVAHLVSRIDLALEPDVDLESLALEIDEGLALIASMYPEARSQEVRGLVYAEIRRLLRGLGIGQAPGRL